MTSNTVMVTNCRSGYLDCSTKHTTLARRKVVSVFFSLFQYFKDHYLQRSRMFRWRSHVSCPQADVSLHLWCVSCGKAALFGLCCSPKGRVYFLFIALDSATTCGRFVCYTLSPHCRDNRKSTWYFNHANKQEQLALCKLLLFWPLCTPAYKI